MTGSLELVVAGALSPAGDPVDLGIADGRIAVVTEPGALAAPAR